MNCLDTESIELFKSKKFAPSRKNEGANFALFTARKSAKISLSGQTCGQRRKMGLFTPESREGQAH